MDEWLTIDPQNEELYRIVYKAEDCYPPKLVVERARTRLNECK